MADADRRVTSSPFTLTKGLPVELVVALGESGELIVPGAVVAMTDCTVSVEVADGPLGLAVGMSPRCTVVVAGDTPLRAVIARPGRRAEDIHSPTLIELVLEQPKERAAS